jgi:small conductance mechanosensitive channel
VAIGMAWSGLLAHFAAGAFLVVLRPFKVGDFVSAAGVVGTVREIGMFSTTIVTPDNVVTVVGNNAIFATTIQNFTANPYRRVDIVIQAPHGVDPGQVQRILKSGSRRSPT